MLIEKMLMEGRKKKDKLPIKRNGFKLTMRKNITNIYALNFNVVIRSKQEHFWSVLHRDLGSAKMTAQILENKKK